MYCRGRLADGDDDDDEDHDAEEASGTPFEEEEGVELTYPIALWNERNAARSNAGKVGSYI